MHINCSFYHTLNSSSFFLLIPCKPDLGCCLSACAPSFFYAKVAWFVFLPSPGKEGSYHPQPKTTLNVQVFPGWQFRCGTGSKFWVCKAWGPRGDSAASLYNAQFELDRARLQVWSFQDSQAPFQLKYRLLQRNSNSLSPPTPLSPPAQKSNSKSGAVLQYGYCSGLHLHRMQTELCYQERRRALHLRASFYWAGCQAVLGYSFHMQNRVNRTSEGDTRLCHCHVVHEKLFDFKQIFASRLSFVFRALTFLIPKLIPIKGL